MTRVKQRERGVFRPLPWHRVLLSLLFSIGFAQIIHAQNPALKTLTGNSLAAAKATNELNVAPGETIQERIARVRAELSATVAVSESNLTNAAHQPSLAHLSLRRGLLQRLEQLYQQQITYASELETLKKRRQEYAREAQTWTQFTEPRPYSILLADSIRESIQVERVEIAGGETALTMLAKLAEEQRALLRQSEGNIRQLNESLESGAAEANTQTAQRELERLRSQVAAASVALLDLERQNREERLAASKARLGLLERQRIIAEAGAVFSDADLARVLTQIDARQKQLERDLAEAEKRRATALQALATADVELRQLTDLLSPEGTRATEWVGVRRAQLETADTALASIRFMLQAGIIERTIWEARFASYRSSSVETIRQTEKRLDQFQHRIELWRAYYQQQLDSASSQTSLQEARLAALEATSPLVPLLRDRLAAMRERDQLLLRVVRDIERGDRLIQRLAEGLRDAKQHLPFAGRVRNAFSDAGTLFSRLWNLELFTAQDTITVDGQQISGKRSITLGKILSAIVILIVGYWLTGLASRVMEPIFIKRFRIDANQANLIRRWLRVVLILSLAIFSLVSVKIPLTVFAFAGGALAIGLGFGMQTVIKNFVSGIIILFERPFRVGDVLDVGGQRGTIVSIGIRSSVLQQWDGTETLIPNSTLLENSVTNWTYSNRRVRFTITVGVAYGSDTRRVVQLLSEIAERHGLVEKEPKPQVLFTDFADSALTFEMRFWVNVITANSAQVASDLRQMIAGTFAENDINIAFPQRDLHLDSARPLQVQIVPTLDAPTRENGARENQEVSLPQEKNEVKESTDAVPRLP